MPNLPILQRAAEFEVVPTHPALDPRESDRPPQAEAGRLKRVLFVLNLDPAGKFGSLEEQTLTLAWSFRERGSLFLPVFLRPLDSESADQYAREGLGVEALDLSRFQLPVLSRLLRLIRNNRIDVVHWSFYHPLFNGYLWALTALKPRVELYFTDHISRPAPAPRLDSRKRFKSGMKTVATWRYSKILCVSDYVLDQVRRVTGPRAQRIHHFVNTERFRNDPIVRRDVRKALGVGEEFVAVTVAYLIKDKGIDVAVKALAQLPVGVVLWVVGDGPERGNLQALAQELGMARRVRFLGPKRNVEPFLQAADCALCPSVWAEAAGLVNLEALACGLPVVASRIGGIPEYVKDGRNGMLFASGDHGALAERIRRLFEDPGLRSRMGQEARLMAVERHSTSSLLDEYMGVYRETTK